MLLFTRSKVKLEIIYFEKKKNVILELMRIQFFTLNGACAADDGIHSLSLLSNALLPPTIMSSKATWK